MSYNDMNIKNNMVLSLPQVLSYLEKKFAELESPNKLKAYMGHGAKAWVADFNHPHFMAGRRAMKTGMCTFNIWAAVQHMSIAFVMGLLLTSCHWWDFVIWGKLRKDLAISHASSGYGSSHSAVFLWWLLKEIWSSWIVSMGAFWPFLAPANSVWSRARPDEGGWKHPSDLNLPGSNRPQCHAAAIGLVRWWCSLTEWEAQQVTDTSQTLTFELAQLWMLWG